MQREMTLGSMKLVIMHKLKQRMKHPIQFFLCAIHNLYRAIDKRNWQYFGEHSLIVYPVCRIIGKKYISVGNGSSIGKNARVEAITNYAGITYTPHIVIGDNVCINQNFHCTCAKSVLIGDGTSITANCGVFDIVHPYEDVQTNPRETEIKAYPVKIGRDCLIGMNSVILPGTELGVHCVVGANSVLSGYFPDYSVIVGAPAKVVKRYDFTTQSWRKTDPQGNFIEK